MKVMLAKDDQAEELVTESASLLEVIGEGVRINSLFDPPQLLPGVKVVKIDFLASKVLLARG
jgi:predicted RNA-binding protein